MCNNLLVYYNPNQNGVDPRYAESYRHSLQRLEQLVIGQQEPALEEAVAEMRKQVSALEQQPASNAQLYPNWINPLLEAHANLDRLAASRYTANPPVAPELAIRHTLTLDVARLLLLYQTRTFGSLAVYVIEVDEGTFTHLDLQIKQGFRTMEQLTPDQAVAIAKLKRKYEYIRPRLLQHEIDWVPTGAAYYLGQIIDGLNQ